MAEKEQKECFHIKRIRFFDRSVKIVMQNENGPCPLLSIANVLSLRSELKLPAGIREITQNELITSIVDLLLEKGKQFEGRAADYQQNISDIFPVLQKLNTGVDVNVKFHDIHAFEATPEVAVFELLGIPLVHGWLVDPQDSRTAAVFGNKSYNELVEMLFLVLGDEEMEVLSTGPLRNLSISSHHMHSFSSTIGSPSAPGRTPSATAPGSRSSSFAHRGVSMSETAEAAAAAATATELQAGLRGLSIQEEQQQGTTTDAAAVAAAGGDGHGLQRQQPAAGNGPSPLEQQPQHMQPQPVATTSSSPLPAELFSQPQQQHQQLQAGPGHVDQGCGPAAIADTGADAVAIECIMESMMQEVCAVSQPGSIELGESPTHNALVTRRMAYEGPATAAAGQPSRLSSSTGSAAAAAAVGDSNKTTAVLPSSTAGQGPSMPPAAAAAAAAVTAASDASTAAAEAAVVRRFMESHCSQLTPYGISAMMGGLKEHQLAVFFRNNHFNTLFKYEDAVYLLVTDQGYECESDIVWERLDSVQGDTTFCTSEFAAFVPHRAPDAATLLDMDGQLASMASYSNVVAGGSAAAAGGDMAALTDLDAAIAASLAVEDPHDHHAAAAAAAAAGGGGGGGGSLGGRGSLHHEDADFALALQLQLQEEEAMARAQAQQQQQQGEQQQRQQQGSRLAAVQQQEQQQQQLPLEHVGQSLRQMGQRLATGIQQQYAEFAGTPEQQQQQQQGIQGRRRSSNSAGGRRGAQEEKCSIM